MTVPILWAVLLEPLAIAPRFEIVQAHHITLVYGANPEEWAHLLGSEFAVRIVAEAWNERIQALRLQLPQGIPCTNAIPHITVSHLREVEPVESNTMLATSHQEIPLDETVKVQIALRLRGMEYGI